MPNDKNAMSLAFVVAAAVVAGILLEAACAKLKKNAMSSISSPKW